MGAPETMPWSRDEFEQKLRAKGKRYHIYHPYQVAMNSGKLTKDQIQGWVYNRYYYQISIPIKDAAVLSNMPDRDHRRQWIQRIIDHDGTQGDEGGIEAWIWLGQACGLQREDVTSLKYVLPGVRFAVDAYVNFARRAPWQEAVCSSLTELFAPEIHKERLSNWPQHYPWIDQSGYTYFRKRLSEARRDVDHGLRVTLDYFTSRAQQQRALEILQFKLDILWSMLDAMQIAYGVGPERLGAGAAMPDE
jgi:pyrroloquinoline-quinone synthase